MVPSNVGGCLRRVIGSGWKVKGVWSSVPLNFPDPFSTGTPYTVPPVIARGPFTSALPIQSGVPDGPVTYFPSFCHLIVPPLTIPSSAIVGSVVGSVVSVLHTGGIGVGGLTLISRGGSANPCEQSIHVP